MTNVLCNHISNTLNLDPFGYSTNTLKSIIEEKLKEAEGYVLSHIGQSEVCEDIVIVKEENNRLYRLRILHNLFMEEMKEELELIN